MHPKYSTIWQTKTRDRISTQIYIDRKNEYGRVDLPSYMFWDNNFIDVGSSFFGIRRQKS